jgi:hypothetical protein
MWGYKPENPSQVWLLIHPKDNFAACRRLMKEKRACLPHLLPLIFELRQSGNAPENVLEILYCVLYFGKWQEELLLRGDCCQEVDVRPGTSESLLKTTWRSFSSCVTGRWKRKSVLDLKREKPQLASDPAQIDTRRQHEGEIHFQASSSSPKMLSDPITVPTNLQAAAGRHAQVTGTAAQHYQHKSLEEEGSIREQDGLQKAGPEPASNSPTTQSISDPLAQTDGDGLATDMKFGTATLKAGLSIVTDEDKQMLSQDSIEPAKDGATRETNEDSVPNSGTTRQYLSYRRANGEKVERLLDLPNDELFHGVCSSFARPSVQSSNLTREFENSMIQQDNDQGKR